MGALLEATGDYIILPTGFEACRDGHACAFLRLGERVGAAKDPNPHGLRFAPDRAKPTPGPLTRGSGSARAGR